MTPSLRSDKLRDSLRCGMRAILYLALPLAVGACTSSSSAASEQNVIDKAAAEATAIIQQAEATAMVLQARAMATAMIERADAVSATPVPANAAPTPVPVASVRPQTVDSGASAAGTPAPPKLEPVAQAAADDTIEVLRVGFAVDGGLIMVQFRAPPKIAQQWWQGRVSVIDEVTGAVYNEIPVMPKIGPLIGRPVGTGRLGYVMLVNAPPGLKPGAIVTVVLGSFEQEHVLVVGP
jgi:hypothetical protein